MNKKIVVIVVIVECVLAILLVSFLGKAIESAMKDVYCKEVCFTNENGEKLNGDPIMIELTDSNMSYQLYWRVEAKNTTKKEVEFISSKPDTVIVDATGIVTFFDVTDVTVTIRSTDGSNKSDTVTLIPKRNAGGDVDI